MRRLILGLMGIGVCLFVSACAGKHESSGTCSNSAGCGGNIVGTWKIESSCVSVNPEAMMSGTCTGTSEDTSGLKISGSVTYAADMTYTSNTTVSGSAKVTLPAACLMQNGITLTCDQLSQALAGQPMMMGATAGSCTATSGGGCSCKVTITSQSNSATGTYTTTGSGALTQTPNTGTTETDAYCVRGSTLTISPSSDSTSKGTLTLSKQ